MTVTTDPTADSDRKPGFTITPRVIAILAACDRFGFLTSEQIWRLDGGSRQRCTRILQRCTELGLLAQPRQQQPVTAYFDTRPRVFGLTKAGAHALAAAGVPVDLDVDRASRNRRAVLLQHTIEVADAVYRLEAACAAHGALRLIDQPQLRQYLPADVRDLQRPFSLSTEVRPGDFPRLGKLVREPVRVAAEPDRLLVLARPDATGWALALEVDRGHESVFARRLKGKASFIRKQMVYFSAFRAGLIVNQWGEMCRSLRIATITTSEARIKSMLAAQAEVTSGSASGLFVYTTLHRITTDSALGNIWITSKRDGVSLLGRE